MSLSSDAGIGQVDIKIIENGLIGDSQRLGGLGRENLPKLASFKQIDSADALSPEESPFHIRGH